MVDKREIHVIYEGYPCMDCSPVPVLLLILLILHIYQSVHTEKWQQTKQNNTSGPHYLHTSWEEN